MGSAPPKDYPSPSQQNQASADAGFEPSPTGSALCGFGVPSFTFKLALPALKLPFDIEFPPKLSYGIALKCDLSDPLDAKFGFGGGRKPNVPDADPFDDE